MAILSFTGLSVVQGAVPATIMTFTGLNVVTTAHSIVTVADIKLGENFEITTSGVDLTAATTVTATYGGIALTNVLGTYENTVSFVAPSGGLELGVSHDLVLTVDSIASQPSSQALLPPTGFSYVTLASIDDASFLNDPDYIGNVGGDANNIGAGDQLYYDNLKGKLTFSDTGLATRTDALNNNVNVDVSWSYLDAQDSYATGAMAVLTLLRDPANDLTDGGYIISFTTTNSDGLVNTGTTQLVVGDAGAYIFLSPVAEASGIGGFTVVREPSIEVVLDNVASPSTVSEIVTEAGLFVTLATVVENSTVPAFPVVADTNQNLYFFNISVSENVASLSTLVESDLSVTFNNVPSVATVPDITTDIPGNMHFLRV